MIGARRGACVDVMPPEGTGEREHHWDIRDQSHCFGHRVLHDFRDVFFDLSIPSRDVSPDNPNSRDEKEGSAKVERIHGLGRFEGVP